MNDVAAPGRRMVRALFRAVSVPGSAPHNVVTAKVYYPAIYSGTPVEKNTGNLPAEKSAAPYPIAIMMPGINVSPESYGWLATALTEAGFVTVLYGWICEELPGTVALSPGLDVGALKPETYGTRAPATALGALIADLEAQNASGPLAGRLDTDRILLGGHSAGGSVALFNARPDWFPGLKAVFSYGSHSKASTMLGYPPDTLLQLPDELPKLILGGSEDGVIAASIFRYGGAEGAKGDPTRPVLDTFEKACRSARGDVHVGIVRGANHFSLTWPPDNATGRPFLDWPIQRPEPDIRADLGALIVAFARAYVGDDAAAAAQLHRLLDDRSRVLHSATR